jgi:bifunctional non-homologous end joining protein LigD
MSARKTTSQSQSASDLAVKLSNPDKVFWPEEGYTKQNLAEFYAGIFPLLQPYVDDRLLTLERCPDGMNGDCFYQKEKPQGMPADTPTIRVESPEGKRKAVNYVVGGQLETQLALVNLGCIPVHVMGGRARAPRKPDWICFDCDPESGNFADAARAGLFIKEALDALKLESFPKTSGSRGLHVFVPIRPEVDASDVLAFAQAVVQTVAAAHPKETTVEHSIAARNGRVYLDPFRNGFGQTVVAPYSVRRRPHAPVSTPLDWKEVKPSLDPASFNMANFAKRAKRKDPWEDFFKSRQFLKAAIKAVGKP